METIYCAGYTRVSSKEQIEGESLTTQKDSITEYAKRNGYELTEIYSDAGISGGNIKDRHALQRCIRDGLNGRFSILIVHRLSRFGRNARELLNNAEELNKADIKFISISENIDFSSKYGKAMLGLLSVIAELEKDIIKETMFENRMNKAKRLIPTSGSLPYGRKFDKKTEQWSLDAEKTDKIKWCAEQYLNGKPLKEVAKKTGLSYVNLLMTLKYRCGDTWEVNFENNQKITYKIPRILSDETIRQVNDRLFLNKSAKPNIKMEEYLLSGLIRCNTCKHTITGQLTNPGGKAKDTYRYYRHRIDQWTDKPCHAFHSIPADKIENAVLQTIFRNFWDIPQFEKSIQSSLPDEKTINDLKQRISLNEKELSVIEKELNKLVDLALEGTLQKDTIKERETSLLERKKRTQLMIVNNTTELESLPDPATIKRQAEEIRKRLLSKYSGVERLNEMTFKEKRELLEYFFIGKDAGGSPYGIYIDKRGTGKNAKIDYFMYGRLTGVATLYKDDINYMGDVDADIKEESKELNDNTADKSGFIIHESKNFPNIARKRPDYSNDICDNDTDACHTKTVQK